MNSALYEGRVRHWRVDPIDHSFEYGLFLSYLDLDELPELFDGRWLWSARRFAPAWFRRRDYLDGGDGSLKEAVLDLVETRTGRRPAGPVHVLTHLRTFGLSFNPVTFYYCGDGDGGVDTIVAQITNTPWLERHAYVLSPDDDVGDGVIKRFRFAKGFHVSPFIDMDCEYDWSFSEPGDRLTVHMRNLRGGERMFDATMSMERREIDGRSLAAVLVRYPFMTAQVLFAIYWQALRLTLKGAPFFVHPSKRPIMESSR